MINLLPIYYSLSKLSTTTAPIDAGTATIIIRFIATKVSETIGSLFKENNTILTITQVMK